MLKQALILQFTLDSLYIYSLNCLQELASERQAFCVGLEVHVKNDNNGDKQRKGWIDGVELSCTDQKQLHRLGAKDESDYASPRSLGSN